MTKLLPLLIPVLMLLSAPSFAMTENIEARIKRLEKQQQLKREQEQRARDKLRSLKKPEKTKLLINSDNDLKAGRCFDISIIKLSGSSLLSEAEKKQLTSPFIDKCIGIHEINEILRIITNYYISKGFITTRVLLAPQNLSKGTLVILIKEGTFESFLWQKNASLNYLNIAMAMPIQTNDKLNLRDIEQGLDQFNRLRSNQVTTEMLPGTYKGQTKIRLKNNESKIWHLNSSFDNSGQDSTGLYQSGIGISGDNLLNMADFVSFNYQSDIESAKFDEKSVSQSIHYDIPLGYWNFDFDFSYFRYYSQYTAGPRTFISHGRSRNQSLRVNYLFYRDQDSKNGLRFKLNRSQSDNYIENVLLDSSRTLSNLNIEIYREKFIDAGRWNLSVGYHKGLGIWGGLKESDVAQDTPTPEFERFDASFSFNKKISFWGVDVNSSTDIRMQYSDDLLFGAQQFSLGGLYTVRGYKEQSIYGHTGALIRQEFSYDLPALSFDANQKLLGQWQLFLALDTGGVKNREPSNTNFHPLSGWAIGLTSGGGLIGWSLTYARPINQPKGFNAKSSQFDFTISVNY